MFFYGAPEQTAQLYIDVALGNGGLKCPEGHYDEIDSEQELRIVFTYLYRALKAAYTDNADAAVVRIILEDYDAVFERLAEVSEEFRDVVRNGRHAYLPNRTSTHVAKYKQLAGVA